MCTSIVREEPTPACPQTSLASSSRLLSSPGVEARAARSSNSFRRNSSEAPRLGREVLGVQLQVSGLDYLAPAARIAAFQVRVYAGDKLLHAERFRHVVVGAGSNPRTLSSSASLAVIITIITLWSRSRILSHTSIPDSPGSMMSSRIRSASSSSRASRRRRRWSPG